MGHTFASLYVHVVFSTKDRRPFLKDRAQRDAFHGYLGAGCRELGFAPQRIGGVDDHVHLLLSQSRVRTIAYCVQELKKSSGNHMREHGIPDFEWQDGYGAFSCGQSDLPRLRNYIAGQEDHHKTVSF